MKRESNSAFKVIGMGGSLQLIVIFSSGLWIKEYKPLFYLIGFIVVSGVIFTLTFYLRSKGERIFWLIATAVYVFVGYHNFTNPNYLYNDLVLKKRIDNLYIYSHFYVEEEKVECLSIFSRKWKEPFFFSRKSGTCLYNVKNIEKRDGNRVLITGEKKAKKTEIFIDIKTGKIISEKEKQIN